MFDFLMTLCDFQAFKDLMLSYKQASKPPAEPLPPWLASVSKARF